MLVDFSSIPVLLLTSRSIESGPLPSTGITRLRRYYGPIRHLSRPTLALTGSSLAQLSAVHGADFPCCARSISRTCCHHYPGGIVRCVSRSLPSRRRPSPLLWRVGSHVDCFGACSVFTRVTARTICWPPEEAVSESASAHLSPPGPPPGFRLGRAVRRSGLSPGIPVHLGKAHTQSAVELFVLDNRQQLLCEVRCCVVRDDVDITSAPAKLREARRFPWVHVDKIKMVERRGHFEGTGGATLDLSACPLRNMNASPAECVDVVFSQPRFVWQKPSCRPRRISPRSQASALTNRRSHRI